MDTIALKDMHFWDKIADKYAKQAISDEAAYQTKLEITQKYMQPHMKVLEFGCGTGSTAIVHAPHVAHILATDIADNMLVHGRRKAEDAGISNIEFQRAGIEEFEAEPQSFDMILGLNIIHLCADPGAVMKKVRTLLKPAGFFIQSTACIGEMNPMIKMALPVMKVFGKAPKTVAKFRSDDLLNMIDEADLRIIETWTPKQKGVKFIVAQKGID